MITGPRPTPGPDDPILLSGSDRHPGRRVSALLGPADRPRRTQPPRDGGRANSLRPPFRVPPPGRQPDRQSGRPGPIATPAGPLGPDPRDDSRQWPGSERGETTPVSPMIDSAHLASTIGNVPVPRFRRPTYPVNSSFLEPKGDRAARSLTFHLYR